MLSRIHTSIGLSLLATATVFSGCIIEGGRGNSSSDITSSSSGDTTTSSSAGQGGSSSSSTTAGVGGGGGSGGGMPSCVGKAGTGLDVNSCDNMNITPISAGGGATEQCDGMGGLGGDQPPPGYPACKHGFDIFNPGPAETFQKCLAMIGVQNQCDLEPVTDCSNLVFQSTCEVAEITTKCNDLKTACEGAGQAFDAAACSFNLAPFNDNTLAAYEKCFNEADPMLTCQQTHDQCFEQQL